jgi:hypothetical protein
MGLWTTTVLRVSNPHEAEEIINEMISQDTLEYLESLGIEQFTHEYYGTYIMYNQIQVRRTTVTESMCTALQVRVFNNGYQKQRGSRCLALSKE